MVLPTLPLAILFNLTVDSLNLPLRPVFAFEFRVR